MLFQDIPANGARDTIHTAYSRIVSRASEKQLTQRSWSLAELRLSQEEYEWLCQWAKLLDRPFLQLFLRKRERDPELGLVFLLFCTEVARREVLPGTVWEPIRKKLSRDCANYLFPYIAPRVIEAAARQHGLRHVFDTEGGKNWMITVHLQFGLHHACIEQISNWLRGFNIPDGMGHLLGRGRFTRLTSDSFQKLYRDLKFFRHGKIVRSELLRR